MIASANNGYTIHALAAYGSHGLVKATTLRMKKAILTLMVAVGKERTSWIRERRVGGGGRARRVGERFWRGSEWERCFIGFRGVGIKAVDAGVRCSKSYSSSVYCDVALFDGL